RATTNRVVLKDEMCSREHAEVVFTDDHWYLRDLGSLNGTRLNGKTFRGDSPLSPRDEVELGNTQLVFVEEMSQLPDLPRRPAAKTEKLEIRQRLTETHYLPVPRPTAKPAVPAQGPAPVTREIVDRNLSRLYSLALEMGAAETQEELVDKVLDGLLDLVHAHVGEILFLKGERNLEVLAHKHRDVKFLKYQKVSQYVSNEVMLSKQAILAEDVAQDRHLRIRESLTDMHVTSLICAP